MFAWEFCHSNTFHCVADPYCNTVAWYSLRPPWAAGILYCKALWVAICWCHEIYSLLRGDVWVKGTSSDPKIMYLNMLNHLPKKLLIFPPFSG